ncbi:MAG: dihydrofolate reductase family protein, partial [Burkholderiales bacterium]|nr:dihydrofolate reductase family protein [Anaerolineae bacterium]
MGKVSLGISMSLDGFVAGPGDDIQHLFKWYFGGDHEIPVQKGRFTLKISPQSAQMLDKTMDNTGAMVAGRRMFDVAQAWGGNPPFQPCFIVTHNPPPEWLDKAGSPFTFVSDGVESAIRQAQQAAGEKNVAVATPDVAQQGLKLGLIDEIHIDLVPVLLGDGVPLFKHLGIEPLELEIVQVV